MLNRLPGPAFRAGARGLVAAMAMTGLRTATANAGLLEQAPPEAIVEQQAPEAVHRLPSERRTALTELVHWCYGAAGGVLFGLLPVRVRGLPSTGPLFGIAVWLSFELGIAPLFGIRHVRQRKVLGRVVIAADHVLYGIVVAGWLAPDPAVTVRHRRSLRGATRTVHRGRLLGWR